MVELSALGETKSKSSKDTGEIKIVSRLSTRIVI